MIKIFTRVQNLIDVLVQYSPVEDYYERASLNHYIWLVFLCIPCATFFSLYNYLIGHYDISLLIFFYSMTMVGSLYFIPRINQIQWIYHINNLLFLSLMVILILLPEGDGSRILWSYTYPLAAIFLFRSKTGIFWSLTLLLGLCLVFLSIDIYSSHFILRFAVTYIIVTAIAASIDFYRTRYEEESKYNYEALTKEHEHLNDEIARRIALEKKLIQTAQTDSLTGLFNRGHFWDRGEQEVERAIRYKHPLSLAILDIDHFKKINDTFGHPAGDEVLRKLANLFSKKLRKNDIVGRIGGEEFAFLLLQADLEEATKRLEKLREEIEQIFADSTSVTVSIGVADIDKNIKSLDSLYKHADTALYKAKQEGRNQILSYEKEYM